MDVQIGIAKLFLMLFSLSAVAAYHEPWKRMGWSIQNTTKDYEYEYMTTPGQLYHAVNYSSNVSYLYPVSTSRPITAPPTALFSMFWPNPPTIPSPPEPFPAFSPLTSARPGTSSFIFRPTPPTNRTARYPFWSNSSTSYRTTTADSTSTAPYPTTLPPFTGTTTAPTTYNPTPSPNTTTPTPTTSTSPAPLTTTTPSNSMDIDMTLLFKLKMKIPKK